METYEREGRRDVDLPVDRYLTRIDSSSSFVRATARGLRGEPASLSHGAHPTQDRLAALTVGLAALMPHNRRLKVGAALGSVFGVRPERLCSLDLQLAAKWVTDQYTAQEPYPGIVIGSPNGALVHLCVATGMPWLPQTMLVPVRWSDNDPDDGIAAMEFGRTVAPPLLERNPDVTLNHIHDPNQNRIMAGRMAYFRVKWSRLPAAYASFLGSRLAPGAPIVVFDDTSAWPVTHVDDRHVFQAGAHGGLSAEDYLDGSSRVREFLEAQGSPRSRFGMPEPNGHEPEAEWGYDPVLTPSLLEYAASRGHPVLRLRIPWPQVLAASVAELQRRRLRDVGLPADRLLVESYAMVDPVNAERTGSVPYWTFFGCQPGRHAALRYVEQAWESSSPYVDARISVFPHGYASSGVAPPSDWRAIAEHITGSVDLLSGTEQRWPSHFDTIPRFSHWLRDLPTVRDEPLPLVPVESALEEVAVGEVELSRLEA